MLDGRMAMSLDITEPSGAVAFRPVAGDIGDAEGYEVRVEGATLLIARGDSAMRRRGTVPRQWLAIRASGAGGAAGRAVADITEESPEAGRSRAFGLGSVEFETPGRVVVAAASTPEEAGRRAERALQDAEVSLGDRQERMVALLRSAPFESGIDGFDEALQWARLSMDALTVRDSTGTYMLPGAPASPPADGRSTLQVMDALIATGRWDDARRLLVTFGAVQRFDERIDVLGRAPNVVLPPKPGEASRDAAFVTTDATPIYIAAAGDYVRATGDRSLVSGEANFWFKTVFAFRGLLNPAERLGDQLNTEGFLIARQGQSWTRTGIEPDLADRPGLPVEAQGRLYRALRTMTDFATIMGVAGRESGSWYADSADVLLRRFEGRYIAEGGVVDRYDPRGEPDPSVTPNGLLALRTLDIDPARKASLTRGIAERLAYPWGVSTRPQNDSTFHPYLRAPEAYAETNATFGGAVWTWLSGPLASLMIETGATEHAWALVETTASLVEGAGVVGMIPDLLDAHPRSADAEPRAGGALMQPWSIAELIRVAWRDFAGLSYAAPSELLIEPRVPGDWDGVQTRARMGGGHVAIQIEQTAGETRVVLTPAGELPEGAVARVRGHGLEVRVPLTVARGDTAWAPAGESTVEITPEGATVDGDEAAVAARYDLPPAAAWEGFAWLEPIIPEVYPVLRAAEAGRVLTEDELLRDNILAIPILTQTDPDGDAWGATSTYTYPLGVPDYVLDATYLEVAEDDSTTYFRAEFAALAEMPPAEWPTMVAIAISTDDGGETRVGRNAQYRFPDDGGYEYIVFVGDGLVVENARGRVIAEVEPGGGQVFEPASSALVFALPRRLMPRLPGRSRVTMLVGARAGRGVGEFRRVEREATESVGGGKVDASAPNVYDQVNGVVSR
jgi:glycogen debranching enzyme